MAAGDMEEGSEPNCDRYNYYSHGNHTLIIQGFEGIPQNLLVNVGSMLVLLILFAILRKKAWDYGRIALVSRNDERWTALFYGEKETPPLGSGSNESLDTSIRLQDKGFCTWIPAFFKITDADIKRKNGLDALQYLTFQRYLIVFTAIISLLCIAVVLPINLKGTLKTQNAQSFGTTTISNIPGDSPFLWVHAIFSIAFLILAVVMMRHFSSHLKFERDEQATRTLMISGIPPEKSYKNLLLQHFSEAYPEAEIQDIQFAYDIRNLLNLDQKRQDAADALKHSEQHLQTTGERPMMVPYTCGRLCCCCGRCGCKEVDAIDYYRAESERLHALVEEEKVNAFREKAGIAFVTFAQDFRATRVLRDYRASCKEPVAPADSSLGKKLRAKSWTVKYAPRPDDIIWGNLAVPARYWWSKAILVNLVVFAVIFFLTTPTIVLNLLNRLELTRKLSAAHVSPIVVQFIPSLILWSVSAFLPWLIYFSDQLVGHWTKSKEHFVVMVKSFTFLCLMVLVLPSLGLTSLPALLRWMFPEKKDGQNPIFQWQCVFVPDNGAFFVNYIITAAFIGCAFELIRLPELLLYAIRHIMARSDAEKNAVRKYVLWDFQFGQSYAWMLCVFAVVCAYSLLCPLIVIFGLVYLLAKHIVDRYNIYFAYNPSRIDKHIHASAINCMIAAVILLQLNVMAFLVIHVTAGNPIYIVSITCFLISVMLFFGRIMFGWFAKLGPIKYKDMGDFAQLEPRLEEVRHFFVPHVLQDPSLSAHVHGEDTSAAVTESEATEPVLSGGTVNGYGSTGTM